jgi:hypothetical protein
MKKIILFASVISALVMITGCTENSRVKNFGGTGTYEIPSDKKFVNVTWKETELWIVTRNRTASDSTYETYQFQEKSSFGMVEGTYIIKETK